jgi:hypothetical protein
MSERGKLKAHTKVTSRGGSATCFVKESARRATGGFSFGLVLEHRLRLLRLGLRLLSEGCRFRAHGLKAPNLLALDEPEFSAKMVEGAEVGSDVNERDGHQEEDHEDGGSLLVT